jgi:hypothetical protein
LAEAVELLIAWEQTVALVEVVLVKIILLVVLVLLVKGLQVELVEDLIPLVAVVLVL